MSDNSIVVVARWSVIDADQKEVTLRHMSGLEITTNDPLVFATAHHVVADEDMDREERAMWVDLMLNSVDALLDRTKR